MVRLITHFSRLAVKGRPPPSLGGCRPSRKHLLRADVEEGTERGGGEGAEREKEGERGGEKPVSGRRPPPHKALLAENRRTVEVFFRVAP